MGPGDKDNKHKRTHVLFRSRQSKDFDVKKVCKCVS